MKLLTIPFGFLQVKIANIEVKINCIKNILINE